MEFQKIFEDRYAVPVLEKYPVILQLADLP
jgi:hypothetical protein